MTKQSETGRGSSYELYGRVSGTLIGMLSEHVSNIKQAINLTWLVVVILERWLKNLRVDVWGLYQVVLRHVLADWRTTDMTILSVIVDGTLVFGDRLQIFRLSLAHGNRAIPLAWTVVPGPGLVQVKRLRDVRAGGRILADVSS